MGCVASTGAAVVIPDDDSSSTSDETTANNEDHTNATSSSVQFLLKRLSLDGAPVESLSTDIISQILTFLPLRDVVGLRTTSRHFAQAGRMAIFTKLQSQGHRGPTLRRIIGNITQPDNNVRQLLTRTYNEANRRIKRATMETSTVEVRYFPAVPGTLTYENVESILDLPQLHSYFAWIVPNRYGREYHIGVRLAASHLRVIVPIEAYIRETHQKLNELPAAMLNDNTHESASTVLQTTIDRLTTLKQMRCTHATVSSLCFSEHPNSIYQRFVKETELPLISKRTKLDCDSAPCIIDLRSTCLRILVHAEELQDLYHLAHSLTTQHMEQKMKRVMAL